MVSLNLRWGQFKNRALDLLFPRRCLGCGRESDFFCASCRRTLSRMLPPFCVKCGRTAPSGGFCSTCQGWRTQLDGIRSPFRFEGVIRQAIHSFKYNNLRALDQPLAELIKVYLMVNPMLADILIPVPLHPRRLRERGYNQSSLLAFKLGKFIQLPVLDGTLSRVRDTFPQARTTSVTERQQNVAGAFLCSDAGLRGKRVLLIDDVCTSGSTLDACANALKAAGATSVWGLTVAREI